MKKITLIAVLFSTLYFFCANICIAQTIADSSSVAAKEKIAVYAGAAYSSPLHYYGRTDSLNSSAFLPTILVQFSKHFSVTPSFIFIKNSAASFEYGASIINAAYSFGKQKGIAGSISADKFFYKDQAKLVRSAQLGQAGITLSHLNNIVNINTGASVAFSKEEPDFFATAGLEHQFKFTGGQHVFLIKPGVTANAGTQNFTSSYYKNSGSILFPNAQQLVTETSKKFSLLSYEAKLDLIYAVKKFIVSLAPGYVLPQNIITTPNNPSLSENAKNLFFCNAVVVYRITR